MGNKKQLKLTNYFNSSSTKGKSDDQDPIEGDISQQNCQKSTDNNTDSTEEGSTEGSTVYYQMHSKTRSFKAI